MSHWGKRYLKMGEFSSYCSDLNVKLAPFNDDLTRLSGKTEELAGVMQQRYGYSKAQAVIEINNWLRDRDQRAKT